jgi:uncharacterized protein
LIKYSNSLKSIQIGDWSFNEIQLEDIDMYSEYIKKTRYPANLWSSNFAYLWAKSQSKIRKVLWKIVDDMLVTFGYTRKGILYLMCLPFGEGKSDKVVEVVYKCLNYCYKMDNNNKSEASLLLINSPQLEFLKGSEKFNKYFSIVNIVGIERHLSIPKLIALKGKEFERIRNKINKFNKLYPNAIVRKYKTSDYEEIIKLGENWLKKSGQKYSTIFDRVYFPEIIKHCKELKHVVLVVEIDNKIVGMASGGDLPTGEAWGCLLKFMNDFDGISAFLIVEMAKEIHRINAEIQYINTGSDLGPGGLRVFKESFRPVLNYYRYEVFLR